MTAHDISLSRRNLLKGAGAIEETGHFRPRVNAGAEADVQLHCVPEVVGEAVPIG